MILDASNVTKSFGRLEVLRGISLRLAEEERVGLLGPSGCGKTTFLRILLGLETLDGGSVTGRLSRAGYLPQDSLLLPWKTVTENVELPLEIRGVSRRARRAEAAARIPRFGLAGFENAFPHELSGGMRQRAALLRAVLAGDGTLVLDEPFGALDTLTRLRLQEWMSDLILDLRRTLLFVTHDLEEAVVLSDRVLVLSERPGSVVGEAAVGLSACDRSDRLGSAFAEAKARLVRMILEAERSDP
jgi:putative hydroxymethylpyrimidine transport system ATP-binding protein